MPALTQHEQLLADLAEIRAQFANARVKAGLVMRGKYDFIIGQLATSGKALIVLDPVQFNNASEASMQQAFTGACKKLNRSPLTVVFFNDRKLLIDYTHDNVDEELTDFFLAEKGVTREQLYEATTALDRDTRNLEKPDSPDTDENDDSE